MFPSLTMLPNRDVLTLLLDLGASPFGEDPDNQDTLMHKVEERERKMGNFKSFITSKTTRACGSWTPSACASWLRLTLQPFSSATR